MTKVLSLGGSIVAPEGPDPAFLSSFRSLVGEYLAASADRRLILVVGGGGPARLWQKAYRDVVADDKDGDRVTSEAQDLIGIMV